MSRRQCPNCDMQVIIATAGQTIACFDAQKHPLGVYQLNPLVEHPRAVKAATADVARVGGKWKGYREHRCPAPEQGDLFVEESAP